MTPDQIDNIGQKLFDAERGLQPIAPVRDAVPAKDLALAYAIQNSNTERFLKEGRRLVGRKIGLTAKAVQAQLGVDQPDFGMLFADMSVDESGVIPAARLIQPKIEAEIAFVIGAPLRSERHTLADIMRAVDHALPALEIVDSRIRDWDIGIVDTIADNASSGMFVLGGDKARVEDLDLRRCGMVLETAGEPASTGAGAACLGNPLNAVRWLADKMTEYDRSLDVGDVVLSGALGPMVAARPGDRFEARISGLGSVRVAFEG